MKMKERKTGNKKMFDLQNNKTQFLQHNFFLAKDVI